MVGAPLEFVKNWEGKIVRGFFFLFISSSQSGHTRYGLTVVTRGERVPLPPIFHLGHSTLCHAIPVPAPGQNELGSTRWIG